MSTFVPYAQRAPQTDDLNELREELSLQRELHGRRSDEAKVAFERLFGASCRAGRPLDGLRLYSSDEVERFFAQVRYGTDGHAYWMGAKHGFYRNDGKSRKAVRWWYEHLHGPLTPYQDVIPNCGQTACINPDHCLVGRDVRRRRFSEEQMLSTLQVCAMRLGRDPTVNDWRRGNYNPTPSVYRMRFGSWEKALRAAGLATDYIKGGKKATPDYARKSLREARRFLGHIPRYEEYRQPLLLEHLRDLGLLTSQTAIKKQIGPSWADSIRNTFG